MNAAAHDSRIDDHRCGPDVQRMREFAEKPANWQEQDPKKPFVPSSGHYVGDLDTFHCVFAIVQEGDKLWRRLSVSVPDTGYPNAAATFAIADLFGFPDWDGSTRCPSSWKTILSQAERSIVLLYPYEK